MILSADDFGISPAVDEAILQLIEKKRISSTGCMVANTNPELRQNLISLKNSSSEIDVGLHLVLTDTAPLGKHRFQDGLVAKNGKLPNLKTLATKAYLGILELVAIETEILAQIENFKSVFGRTPDFIDGHQHVQQLPIVRHAIVSSLKKFNKIGYVRIANLPNSWIWNSSQLFSPRFALENLALAIPGRQSAILFSENKIKHNRYLLGYYRHTPDMQFRTVFEKYLSLGPAKNDIFFCHPGNADEHLKKVDRLVDSRKDNLEFLMSPEFQDTCEKFQVSINRFRFENGSCLLESELRL